MFMQMKKIWVLKKRRKKKLKMKIHVMKRRRKKRIELKNQRLKATFVEVHPNWSHHQSRNGEKVQLMNPERRPTDQLSHVVAGTKDHDHPTEWILIRNGMMLVFKLVLI